MTVWIAFCLSYRNHSAIINKLTTKITQYYCRYVCIENYCNKLTLLRINIAKTQNFCLECKCLQDATYPKSLKPIKRLQMITCQPPLPLKPNQGRFTLFCRPRPDISVWRIWYVPILFCHFDTLLIPGTAEKSACSICLKVYRI